jgi:hypothetical protein
VATKVGPGRPDGLGGFYREFEYAIFPDLLWTYLWANGNRPKPPPGEGGPVSRVSLFVSPVDPGLDPPPIQQPAHSYPANAWLFAGYQIDLFTAAPDGLSSTVALAEHYHDCRTPDPHPTRRGVMFDYHYDGFAHGFRAANRHRPTFADGGPILNGKTEGDVHPVTTGFPPVTRPSRDGATFQTGAATGGCDPTVPQAHFPHGLLVGMGDGSVRTARAGIAPHVFWSAVTPAGGETVALD